MNWNQKCRLCLTDSPMRPIHALDYPELLTTLKNSFEIQLLPDDRMDIICATCMDIISKVKFFKSNQNVIKECRSFCINLGIKQEKDDRDDDCVLIEDVETNKTAEVILHLNNKKRNLVSTPQISPKTQNESITPTSINNDSPKIKKCKVVVNRLKFDNMSTINNKLDESDCVIGKKDGEKRTLAIISQKKMEYPTGIEPTITTTTNNVNIIKNIILDNKHVPSESSSTPTSTLNSIPKNIKWTSVKLSQPSVHTDATTASTRLSFVSNNTYRPTILMLPSTLKINKIPSKTPLSKVALESLPKNNNIAFNAMHFRTAVLPTSTVIQTGFGTQEIKTSTESKVDSSQGTSASSTSVLNQRPIKPIKIAPVPISPSAQVILPRAQSFERIKPPMKLESHSTLERYRILNGKITLRNSNKVKVLSVNELNKKSDQTKSQSTAYSRSSAEPSQGTQIGVVNPNNANAAELTVRFVRQSSKFCIIILLYGRIVTFGDLNSHQLQCLKRLLVKNLKTSVMNSHRFLLTHTPDEDTLKLLRVLHIDHLLRRSH